MPERIGEAILRLGTDAAQLDKGIRGAHRAARKLDTEFDRTTQRVSQHFNRIAAAITAVVGAVAIKRLGGAFLEAARTTENLRLRLDALLGSTQQGARTFELMREFAKRVPFEFQAIMNSAAQLAGIVRGGADEIAEYMPMIADLAAVSGLTMEQTTDQIVRCFSAGAGAADLFRQRGISAMLGFQYGVSYTADETRRRILAAWHDTESKFRGASLRMATTWDGLMSMFRDRWFDMADRLTRETGLFDEAKQALEGLLEKLDSVMTRMVWIFKARGPVLGEAAELLGDIVANAFSIAVLSGLKSLNDKIIDTLGPIGKVIEFLTRDSAELAELIAEATDNLNLAVQALENTARGARALARMRTGVGEPGEPEMPVFPEIIGPTAEQLGGLRMLELPTGAEEAYQRILKLSIAAGEAGRNIDNMGRASQTMTELAESVSNQFGGAIVDAVMGLRDFESALLSITRTLMQEAFTALVQWALPFQAGGMIPSLAPAVPILAHPGEAILNQAAVRRLGGAPVISQINAGAATPQEVTVRLTAEDIPEPTDYGMIALKSQVLRLFGAIHREWKYRGGK